MTTSNLAQATGTVPQTPNAFWAFIDRLPGMQFLKNLSIGTKLNIGFGILVLLTVVGAIVSYVGSTQATAKIDTTEEVRVPTALVSARAQADLLRMLGDVRGYLALGEGQFQDSYEEARQSFEADLVELEQLSPNLDPKNKRRLEDLRATFEKWSALPDKLFALRDDQLEREPAYALLATQGIRTAGSALIDIQSMIEAQAQRDPSRQNAELLEDMAKLQGSFTAMLSGLRGYVTTRNRVYRQEYQSNLEFNEFAWQALKDKQGFLDPNQQELLANIEQNRTTFLELPTQMFELLEGERWREDLFLFRTEAIPLTTEMQQLLADLTTDQQLLLETDLNRGRQELANANQQTLIGGIVALVLGLGMAVIFRENIAGPVSRLTSVAEQIRGGDLEAQARVESKDETGLLAETFNRMTGQLRQTLLQVRKEKKRADDLLDVVIPIGVDLTSEKNFNRLLEKMLLEAKSFCHADAGILYLRRAEDKSLEYVSVSNDTLNMVMGGTTGNKITFAPLPLSDPETGEPNHHTIATHVALTGESLNIADADAAETPEFSGPKIFGSDSDYHAKSYLTIPLKNSLDQVVGVLQLINAKDPETHAVIPFDMNLQQMMASFSSLAVAALEAYIREESLKQEIKQLRVEIDQARRQQEVNQIVDTEVFRDLKTRASDLRERKRRRNE